MGIGMLTSRLMSLVSDAVSNVRLQGFTERSHLRIIFRVQVFILCAAECNAEMNMADFQRNLFHWVNAWERLHVYCLLCKEKQPIASCANGTFAWFPMGKLHEGNEQQSWGNLMFWRRYRCNALMTTKGQGLFWAGNVIDSSTRGKIIASSVNLWRGQHQWWQMIEPSVMLSSGQGALNALVTCCHEGISTIL